MNGELSKLASNIVKDLLQESKLSDLLLRVMYFASRSNDLELKQWVYHEIHGYNPESDGFPLPDYRKLSAGVKIDVHRGFQQVLGFEYPVEMIKNNEIYERIRKVGVFQSLPQIEEMIDKMDTNSKLHVDLPVQIWPSIIGISGTIQRAYQYCNPSDMVQIPMEVKAILLDFFMSKEEDFSIDFFSCMRKKTVIPTTINAAVVNTGGTNTIHATHITNVVGSSNDFLNDDLQKLKCFSEQLVEILKSVKDKDCQEYHQEIRNELQKDSPSKKVLRKSFLALKSIVGDIVQNVASQQAIDLINSCLALLG